ncbi:MAG: radical SAM protein, partial [bacterium]
MKFKYIYGPVASWRLGNSLGIDLLSQKEKICNFDCCYCQIGRNLKYLTQRKLYVSTQEIIEEIKRLPDCQIDYITFSGRGESTLAINLSETITAIKKLRKEPIAVLTNSTLINKVDVRQELTLADFVILKLDAFSQETLELINNPARGIKFDEIYNGIRAFREEYRGKLALQIMFIDENKNSARRLFQLAREIQPD